MLPRGMGLRDGTMRQLHVGTNLIELNRNVAANRLDNVEVIAKAVGDEDGIASLHSGLNSGIALDGEGDFTTPICCLDTALTSPVDFIKIDVEGYEGHVLHGAQRTLRRYHPTLFVEIHPALIAPLWDAVCGQRTLPRCLLLAIRTRFGPSVFPHRMPVAT